ncbi:MAG: nuclear transport factor 2 family protein [Melioribacteraceae bacterium]
MKTIFILIFVATLFSSCGQNQKTNNAKNVELVNQYFDHFNKHNWEKMAAMYSETAEFKDPSLGQGIVKQTREEIAKKYSELSEIFPDIKDKIIETYPSGEDHIIIEFVSSGTAPDGSKFELPICTIFEFENGKIIKDYSYFDNFEE